MVKRVAKNNKILNAEHHGGVYSLLVGADAADGASPSLPLSLPPPGNTSSGQPSQRRPRPLGAAWRHPRVVLGPGDGSVACLANALQWQS